MKGVQNIRFKEVNSAVDFFMNISRKFSKVVKSQQAALVINNSALSRNFASKSPKDVKPKQDFEQDHYRPEVNQVVTSAGMFRFFNLITRSMKFSFRIILFENR